MIYPRVSLYFTSFRGLTQKCREPIRRIFIRMKGNDQLLQVIFLTILQQKNKAVLAIQIRSPYVYFVETGSGTTEEYGEKQKVITKYDLCSGIDSAICTGQGNRLVQRLYSAGSLPPGVRMKGVLSFVLIPILSEKETCLWYSRGKCGSIPEQELIPPGLLYITGERANLIYYYLIILTNKK